MSVDIGETIKVKTPQGEVVKRRVEKGLESIDDNIYFVTPVVRIEGVWYEVSNKEGRRGYREIVKKFDGDRVGDA